MSQQPNPYQSPANLDSQFKVNLVSATSVTSVPRRWFDKLALFTVSLASGLYFAFIAVLVDYGSMDRVIGVLFLINGPILVLWIVQLLRRRRVSYSYGFIAASTQVVIMLAMISVGLSNMKLIMTNLVIAFSFGVLALQCHMMLRLAKSSTRKRSPFA